MWPFDKYIHLDELHELLNFARSIGKRLDEHRELVISIQRNTTLFNTHFWHINHLAIQDDFLMRLFFTVHKIFPDHQNDYSHSDLYERHQTEKLRLLTHEYVRPRPSILGVCNLPEYKLNSNKRISTL